jgi:hypothetical protein
VLQLQLERSYKTLSAEKGSQEAARVAWGNDEQLGWDLEGRSSDCKVYDFSQILDATSNFSDENKLGQGGFGPVYKVSENCLIFQEKNFSMIKVTEGKNEETRPCIYK